MPYKLSARVSSYKRGTGRVKILADQVDRDGQALGVESTSLGISYSRLSILVQSTLAANQQRILLAPTDKAYSHPNVQTLVYSLVTTEATGWRDTDNVSL